MDHKRFWVDQLDGALAMPLSRYRALRRVCRRPFTQRELARAMDIDAPATTVLVNDLVERGLAERAPHPTDGRRRVVTATQAGRDLMDDLRTRPDLAPPEMSALTDDECAQLTELIDKLRTAEHQPDAGDLTPERGQR